MESKLKAAAQDSVGELPNLLLREGGYPHLLLAKELIWSSDSIPKKVGVYKVRSASHPEAIRFSHWSGLAFGKFGMDIKSAIECRNLHSSITDIQWNIKESVQVPEAQLTGWFDGSKQNPFHVGSYAVGMIVFKSGAELWEVGNMGWYVCKSAHTSTGIPGQATSAPGDASQTKWDPIDFNLNDNGMAYVLNFIWDKVLSTQDRSFSGTATPEYADAVKNALLESGIDTRDEIEAFRKSTTDDTLMRTVKARVETLLGRRFVGRQNLRAEALRLFNSGALNRI